MSKIKQKLNTSLKKAKNEITNVWTSYQPISPSSPEFNFKNELAQFIKDIEDTSKSDTEAWEKFRLQNLTEELKLKVKEFRIGPNKNSILHLAAKNCRKLFCAYLINDIKIDKDVKAKDKTTPLHFLVKSNTYKYEQEEIKPAFFETYKFLLEKGIDLNAQDENGYSALHFAIAKNSHRVVSLLLDTPRINIQVKDKKGFTPLHSACKYGFDKISEFLIEEFPPEILLCHSDLNEFPVHVACRNKTENLAIVNKMLNKIREYSQRKKNNSLQTVLDQVDNKGQNILHISVENNHLEIVKLLLAEYYGNREQMADKDGNYPVHIAAKNGSIEILSLFKKHGVVTFNLNYNQENPLHIASINNKAKFVRELLNFEKIVTSSGEHSCEMHGLHMECICSCDSLLDRHTRLIFQKDFNGYTPLHSAIVAGSLKCMYELLKEDNIEREARDNEDNTVFHLSTEYNNIESLKHFLMSDIKTDLIYSKNNADETILHLACRNGCMEIVKIMMNKLPDSNRTVDEFLFAKNRDGQTCFQVACVNGYLNIVEYFLKEKKIKQFIEHHDNNLNTCLHLATENGHSTVVNLLLEHNVDFLAKNEENFTALDLSCRKGFFEISKSIINEYPIYNENENTNEFPLHTACNEGAYEVVKLILQKSTPIDQLDHQNRNCLDIAIDKGHREVIRVLLDDPNWHKLIRLTNKVVKKTDEDDDDKLKMVVDPRSSLDRSENYVQNEKNDQLIECPEFSNIFDHKMWDVYKLILDKCVNEKEVDFSIIDPPVKAIAAHPLMLIARSGQENLLKHETTRMLLHLKWRVIPRCAFYFNLGFYMIFLLLFSLYSVDLSLMGRKILDERNATWTKNMTKTDMYKSTAYTLSNYNIMLIVVLNFQLFKEIMQILFLDGLAYFMNSQNLIEIFTYTLSLISLLSRNYHMQSAYGSMAVLSAFILFPLFIQKLKIFGLYVVAFRRTLTNSAKFFPIFLIVFTGFILSFRIRSNFEVSYFNSTGYSIIRTLTMVVGEMDTAKMGLYDGSLTNYLIYFLFIGLMCTIVLNLFVGIAVGEIKTVLDEADIQQISMRIVFVLKIQSALIPFQKTFLKKMLNMSFTKYSLENESGLGEFRNKIWHKTKDLFSGGEHTIKLSDPQKRLEEQFKEMERKTEEQIKSIRFGFLNQLSDTEQRLFISQIKLQDSIIELDNSLNEQITIVRDGNSKSCREMLTKLELSETKLGGTINDLAEETNNKLELLNEQFNNQILRSQETICSLNNRVQNILIDFSSKTHFQFESTKELSTNQTNSFKRSVICLQETIEDSFNDLTRTTKLDFELFEKSFLEKFEVENEKKLNVVIQKLNTQNDGLVREIRSMENSLANLTNLISGLNVKIDS